MIIGKTTIDGVVRGNEFSIAANQWIARESGAYRLELENLDGVAGTAGQWNLRVEPDTPPSVAWQQPSEDLFVLPTATVPLAVVVKDNLAVARVELRYTRSDQSDAKAAIAAAAIELYRGPESAVVVNGESHTVEHSWSLAPLDLPVGAQLTLDVHAADYRPGSGKTLTPRRITIVSRDELDARLADEQSQIARRLDEALALERTAHRDVRGLEIQIRDAGRLSANDQDVLQASELNQRRVGRLLVDPTDGVPALANALAAELQMNGIDDADLLRQMENLKDALAELAAGPLAAADQALTAARKSVESNTAGLAESLTTAGNGQDAVIAVLERLLGELSGWAEYGRFVRELAALRDDQLAHRKTTREEIGLDTLPLELRELSRQQRATLNKAAAAEDTLARRFERIEQGMDALAAAQAERDAAAAARLADAVDLARQLAIAGNMQQTMRDLEGNRVGQALAREAQIAAALQQVLDTLQNRSESRPEQLVEKLRAAERELAVPPERAGEAAAANRRNRAATAIARRCDRVETTSRAATAVAKPNCPAGARARSAPSHRGRPQHATSRRKTGRLSAE